MLTFKTADLSDHYGNAARHCTTQFRHFGATRAFSGQIQTVKTFEDSGLAIECLRQPGDGKVLVIDGCGSLRFALVGDKMARLAMDNGWSGMVVYGAIRDAAEIDTLKIGILALGTVPARGSRDGSGQHDVPVSFGEVEFEPGHYVCCDQDGVLVLERAPSGTQS